VAAATTRTSSRVLLGIVIIAALAMTSTAKAGLPSLLGTGPASYCDPAPAQVFAPWGDSSYYATLLNGGFEGGSAGWFLSGGARVVSGNEPFFASGNAGDSKSLLLPTGSSAYSGTVCFALGDWHMRLFARNVGSRNGALRVQVIVPSLLGGLLTILDGGTINGDGTWAPSPRLQLLLCNVTRLIGTKAVAFRFTPTGHGAAYQIDDVYLDPWKGT
jgi:hypothetical protein